MKLSLPINLETYTDKSCSEIGFNDSFLSKAIPYFPSGDITKSRTVFETDRNDSSEYLMKIH